MAGQTTPRRFRRRLLVVMITLGLLPLAAWGGVSHLLMAEVLSLRPSRLDELLARVDGRLTREPAEAALRDEIASARVNLVQAELARRSLSRVMPRLLVLFVVVSGLVLAGAAVFVGRQLARPLELLAGGMARYARGDLVHRLPRAPASDDDELQFLMGQFNRMGDELAAQRARLEVTEALAAWQGVARSLAHELRNPLTAMRMAVGRLARLDGAAGAPRRRTEALDLVERQIEVLLRLSQSFSAFAKLPVPSPRPSDLTRLVRDVCALYGSNSPVPVEADAARECTAVIDPELLAQALGNLVKNAIEASAPGGESVRVTLVEQGASVRLEVTDGGCGIEHVLEGAALARSLGTTKAQGQGLGLPVAQKIVHEHGGRLRLEPRPEGGCRAVIDLPLAAGA